MVPFQDRRVGARGTFDSIRSVENTAEVRAPGAATPGDLLFNSRCSRNYSGRLDKLFSARIRCAVLADRLSLG